jgi:hypothetical protein
MSIYIIIINLGDRYIKRGGNSCSFIFKHVGGIREEDSRHFINNNTRIIIFG